MKTLAFIHRNDTLFSVGDFHPVKTVFSHHELGNTVSPFLLLDHLGPGILKPTHLRKGVTEHPHRGFETVTIMFKVNWNIVTLRVAEVLLPRGMCNG